MIHPVDFSLKVRSYEIDVYQHVNQAVYASWLEHGRLEFLQSEGYSYKGLFDQGWQFVVARSDLQYRRSALLNDEIIIRTGIEKYGRTSVTFRQEVLRGEELLLEAAVVMVFLNADLKPTPIPDDFKKLFQLA